MLSAMFVLHLQIKFHGLMSITNKLGIINWKCILAARQLGRLEQLGQLGQLGSLADSKANENEK